MTSKNVLCQYMEISDTVQILAGGGRLNADKGEGGQKLAKSCRRLLWMVPNTYLQVDCAILIWIAIQSSLFGPRKENVNSQYNSIIYSASGRCVQYMSLSSAQSVMCTTLLAFPHLHCTVRCTMFIQYLSHKH